MTRPYDLYVKNERKTRMIVKFVAFAHVINEDETAGDGRYTEVFVDPGQYLQINKVVQVISVEYEDD